MSRKLTVAAPRSVGIAIRTRRTMYVSTAQAGLASYTVSNCSFGSMDTPTTRVVATTGSFW
jgi:hypothetical protein